MNDNGQLDFFGGLGEQPPVVPVLEPEPEPLDGIAYLEFLIEEKAIYIFMIGANVHLRFVRSFSSDDPAPEWGREDGVPVMYAEAEKMMRAAGYCRHSLHTFGRAIGNTGKEMTAEVWRSR